MSELHVVDASSLGTQAVILADWPDPSRFTPIRHREHRKPDGGLFTCTYLGPDQVSDWWGWAEENRPDMVDGRTLYVLEPAAGQRLIEVDSVEDAVAVFERYGSNRYPDLGAYSNRLDFLGMAGDRYAGFHLSRRGFATSGGNAPTPLDFQAFNCESTVWFVWPDGDWSSVGTVIVRHEDGSVAL